jgi:hypothetical protein
MERCRSTPPGSRIRVDDTAGASGEASGTTYRMGWTGSRRPGPRRVTAKHQLSHIAYYMRTRLAL